MKSTSGGAPPIGFLASNRAKGGHGDRRAPSPAHWSPDSRVIDSAWKSVKPRQTSPPSGRFAKACCVDWSVSTSLGSDHSWDCSLQRSAPSQSLGAGLQRPLQDATHHATHRFSSLLQATLPAQNRRPKIAGPLHSEWSRSSPAGAIDSGIKTVGFTIWASAAFSKDYRRRDGHGARHRVKANSLTILAGVTFPRTGFP